MILSGGVVGSVLLLLVAYAAVWLRYRTNHILARSWFQDAYLWVSVLSIFSLGVYGIVRLT
jgi:hypothetical protein